MADEKRETDTPAGSEESGAGYGNNAVTDDVASPGKRDGGVPEKPDD